MKVLGCVDQVQSDRSDDFPKPSSLNKACPIRALAGFAGSLPMAARSTIHLLIDPAEDGNRISFLGRLALSVARLTDYYLKKKAENPICIDAPMEKDIA